MTNGKNIALTIQIFVGIIMSLLFNLPVYVCQSFSSKEQVSFNFTAAVTICSDFGAPQNKVLISHTSKVILKVLQARFQQYMNCESPDVQAEFR